jgi:hypothetical protein
VRLGEFVGRLFNDAREKEAHIRRRRVRTLITRADYKDGLAENYREVGMDERAECLRDEAAKLRLEAEYDVIRGNDG